MSYVEFFHVDAVVACKQSSFGVRAFLRWQWLSHVFKPDSVLPLTARKKASIAVRLPKEKRMTKASRQQLVMYISDQGLDSIFFEARKVILAQGGHLTMIGDESEVKVGADS